MAVNALARPQRIYTPQTHPAQWTSTQTNSANALQYLPSVHQQENLDEAVQLYEEVLQYRDPQVDPLGRPIPSNQGNALGHLGVFTDAKERLERALGHVGDGRGHGCGRNGLRHPRRSGRGCRSRA